MVDGQFKSARFLRLFIETIFYCFFISMIFYILNPEIGISTLIKSAFPFAPHAYSYWFINKFLALILLQPFLSHLATSITKRQYQFLLFVLLMINSELIVGFPFSAIFDNGWSLPWFITLFFIGGYIKLYDPFQKVKKWGGYWLLSVIVFAIVSTYFSNIFNLQYNQWFFFGKSFCLFMFVRNISIAPTSIIGKIVKFISPNVLSVYLIHNQHLMIAFLISLGGTYAITTNIGIHLLYWCLFGIAIILLCTLIDKFRIYLFNISGISNLINRLSGHIDARFLTNQPSLFLN